MLTGTAGARTVADAYKDVLKFYDGAELTVMPGTNNETYQLVDNGAVVMGFVDPTDKFSADGKKVASGYTMYLLDKNGSKIPSKAGQTWTFDPYNGTVQFANG